MFSVQTLDGCEVLLGPEVTYGPPGLNLLRPVAMTIAHCAEVDAENWNVQLKRRTQDSKWEVRTHTPELQTYPPVGSGEGGGAIKTSAGDASKGFGSGAKC